MDKYQEKSKQIQIIPQKQIPTQLTNWFQDGNGNPVANQYYNINTTNYELIADLRNYITSPDQILIKVTDDTLQNPLVPTDIIAHIKSNAKPPPILPASPSLGTGCNYSNNNKIRVLSWNISWEAMTGKNFGTKCGVSPNKCLNNVSNFIKNNGLIQPFDFIGLQEASKYYDIRIKSGISSIMTEIHYKPGIEDAVLFYNNKYKLNNILPNVIKGNLYDKTRGAFSNGRPFIIGFFENNLCVISLHAGHNGMGNFDEIEDAMKKQFSTNYSTDYNKIVNRLKTWDLIIMGDFNINLKNTTFFGRNLNGKHNTGTCCDTNLTANTNAPYDQILTSFSTITTNIYQEKDASDHLPVIAEITSEENIKNTFNKRYSVPYNSGTNNPNNNCWIASGLQIIFAIKDIRNFILKNYGKLNNILQSSPTQSDSLYNLVNAGKPLLPIIQMIDALYNNNQSLLLYDKFVSQYGEPGQQQNKEGDAVSFLGHFFYYFDQFLKVVNTSSYSKMFILEENDSTNSFNVILPSGNKETDKLWSAYSNKNIWHYYFDTAIKKMKDDEPITTWVYDNGNYVINRQFTINDFNQPIYNPYNLNPLDTVAELFIKNFYSDIVIETGTISIQMAVNGQTNYVHSYKTTQLNNLPKIMPMVIYPNLTNTIPPKWISGSLEEIKYLKNINICVSIQQPGIAVPINYFLIGIVCFQDTIGASGHFIAITIHKFEDKQIIYKLYDASKTPQDIKIQYVSNKISMFDHTVFTNPTYTGGNNFFPYILIYEKF